MKIIYQFGMFLEVDNKVYNLYSALYAEYIQRFKLVQNV